MTDEPERLDEAWVEEGFMQPTRKRITFQCPICSHTWTRTFKAEPSNDPACPNKYCADRRALVDLQKQVANLTAMIQSGQAPAQIGNNVKVQAIDTTAKIVMEDNKLTNLRDGIRMGESMAPPLEPVKQQAADAMFAKGAEHQQRVLGTGATLSQRQRNQMKAMGARAIAGGYRDASIAPNQVLPTTRPQIVTKQNDLYNPKRN